MGFIIWIIIIVWVVVALSRNKGKTTGQKTVNRQQVRNAGTVKSSGKRPEQNKTENYGDSWLDERNKQQELKARLSKKYNRSDDTSKGDILQRARASVEEDFANNNSENGAGSFKGNESYGTAGGFEARAVGASVSNTSIKMEDAVYKNPKNDQDRQKEMERRIAEKLETEEWKEGQKDSRNLLRTVEDLMVMGPNAELSYERDFLAEGLDMLNRIQA